jgi:pimeloyl-ACP methyl ester carboxylesterase
MDLPGHGSSDAFEKYDIELLLDCIKYVCEKQNFTNFIVSGHSMGGMLAVVLF